MNPATPLDAMFARAQMAYSLGFHIIFAAVGIAMPLLMVMAEIRWLRSGDAEYLELARRWAKGTAVFFAVGAVSGTVLSFELGLLFPGFMHHAGAIVGLPFSLEGFAFFTEAIFLGLYLYAWQRVSPRLHIAAGFVVAASGLASAVFVTIVNAWMNAPLGYEVEYGRLVNIDPVAAMRSPFVAHEVVHTSLSAYMATAFAVAAIHAWALLRPGPARVSFHRKAMALSLAMAIPAALAQPVVGHLAGQQVARHQPLKFAAMEGVKQTQAGAPLHVGPIAIPGGLSFMAFNDPKAEVQGLDAFPPEDHPHPVVHAAFLGMVGLGLAAAAFAAVTVVWWIRRRWSLPEHRRWLQAALVLGPSGVLATELGWIVTEVGRQPWTVYNVLRTRDLVTPVGGLWLPFVTFAVIYLLLGAVVAVTLWKQVRPTTDAEEAK
jgi:cytochrome d ubiquinol oxidase subunit I